MNKSLTEAVPERKARRLNPVLTILGILLIAMALTYILDAGQYARVGHTVIPGSYHKIEKSKSPLHIFAWTAPSSTAQLAYPASLGSTLRSIPDGFADTAGLIFMVMFVGGMFEIFKKTGSLDAGISRLVSLSHGNIYALSSLLVLCVGLGGALLGLASEYLVLLPVLLGLGRRLKVPPIVSLAVLEFGGRLGYAASISNPVVLPIAQSVVGVPLFSGVSLRIVAFVLFMSVAISYLCWSIRRTGYRVELAHGAPARMSGSHFLVFATIMAATATLIFIAPRYNWHYGELSAFYIFLAIVLGVVGRMNASAIADAFVEGMKSMVLPGLLIGLASTVELVLQHSLVLDTVINLLTSSISGHAPPIVASGILGTEAVLDMLLSSTSGKAAISMPIIAPIAQASGLSGQTAVLAFLFGSGIISLINPTNGLTLAYLAISKVGYLQWLKFALPLVIVLEIAAIALLCVATGIGY